MSQKSCRISLADILLFSGGFLYAPRSSTFYRKPIEGLFSPEDIGDRRYIENFRSIEGALVLFINGRPIDDLEDLLKTLHGL